MSTNDGRTVQVVTMYADYSPEAAHPTGIVATTTLTARSGSPIRLSALFTHEMQALTVLGRIVPKLAAATGQPVTDPSGLKPAAANRSAWQTTHKEFVVYFQDYQLSRHGIRSYAVPGHDVLPLLTGHAKALLAPRR